jgi:hypothetical protein
VSPWNAMSAVLGRRSGAVGAQGKSRTRARPCVLGPPSQVSSGARSARPGGGAPVGTLEQQRAAAFVVVGSLRAALGIARTSP